MNLIAYTFKGENHCLDCVNDDLLKALVETPLPRFDDNEQNEYCGDCGKLISKGDNE